MDWLHLNAIIRYDERQQIIPEKEETFEAEACLKEDAESMSSLWIGLVWTKAYYAIIWCDDIQQISPEKDLFALTIGT